MSISPYQKITESGVWARLLQEYDSQRGNENRCSFIKNFIIYQLREPYPPQALEKFRSLISGKIPESDRRKILEHLQDSPYPQKEAMITILKETRDHTMRYGSDCLVQ